MNRASIQPSGQVNIRLTPDASSNTNILGLTNKGKTIAYARKVGEFWQFDVYLHDDYVTVLSPPPIPPDPENVDTIPYRSQWDDDGNDRQSDCGAACVAMLLQWVGIQVTIDSLPYQTNESGLTTAENLVQNFALNGVIAESIMLPVGAPIPPGAICLHDYGAFNRASVQDTGYYGWHWAVYLGEDEAQVTLHDPDRWGSQRETGDHARFALSDWLEAFRPYSTGDPGRTAVILKT